MTEYLQERMRNIKLYRYFLEDDPSLPGWRRFWPADPRFPITVTCPPGSSPWYNFERSHHLVLETDSGFTVQRQSPIQQDLGSFMKQWAERRLDDRRRLGNSPFASEQERAPYKESYKYHIVDRGGDMAVVGEAGYAFTAPRVVFTTRSRQIAADWVFFARRGVDECWTILRGADKLIEEDFRQVLASFRWLNDEYFRSLPAVPGS